MKKGLADAHVLAEKVLKVIPDRVRHDAALMGVGVGRGIIRKMLVKIGRLWYYKYKKINEACSWIHE